MERLLSILGTVALTFVSAAAASAQNASNAAEPFVIKAKTETDCELHVWPSERFISMSSGWLSGLGLVGALADASSHAKTDQSNRTQIASALDSEGQLRALETLDLPDLFHLGPTNVIFHPTPLDPKSIGKVKTRRIESKSPCYNELIAGSVMYQKAAIYGRSLHTVFVYRAFGARQDKPDRFVGQGGNGLKLFPPKEGEDVQAANDELVSVFKKNVVEYAKDTDYHFRQAARNAALAKQ